MTIDQEVLYRIGEVVQITGRKRSTIYDDIRKGRFPAPVRLGVQSVAWKKSSLDRWIADRPGADAGTERARRPARRHRG